MKIESVRIENFRSFKDETVFLDDYTCLVGPNGGGKSTVLCALNVFFRESENSSTDVVNLSAEDFHQKITDEPIRITVTFVDLNARAQEDFKGYFRQGKLIISSIATFNPGSSRADVKQFGQRLGMEEFRPFFAASEGGVVVAELRKAYATLKGTYSDLPAASTKDAMTEALHAYEADREKQCVPIQSEDQFYGVSKGANRLANYVQWVYIPAVKDVTTEQSEGKATALGKLLARTVRLKLKFDDVIRELQERTEVEYRGILDKHQGALSDIEKVLSDKLSVWAHPSASVKLSWQKDAQKSVQIAPPTARTTAGEGAFEGDLARFGHGFQRSYLLALLQVLAGYGAQEEIPRLILGCEEPELYQHPPQSRHLAGVLEQLSSQDAQVLICTHNPAFITGKGFESVRLVRFRPGAKASACKRLTFEEVAERLAKISGDKPIKPEGMAAKMHQVLQPGINEMFFTRSLVLVEGLEDVAFITSWMLLSGRWDAYRQKGIHLVPVGGKGHLPQALAIAQGLEIPVFTIFDADGHDEKHKDLHKRDNERLLGLLALDQSKPFPSAILWGKRYAIWPKTMSDAIDSEIPAEKLAAFENKANAIHGDAGSLQKNGLQIGSKLQLVFDEGIRPQALEKLCELILSAEA
jgi:putative ATP-dependent endonuclease of OLD family